MRSRRRLRSGIAAEKMKPIRLSLSHPSLNLALSLFQYALPGGCLSQSLSHLQGARLRSSLSWRGSLRRDRAAAAAAEGGAGGRGGGSSLIFFALSFFSLSFERSSKSRSVALRLTLPLFSLLSLSPFLLFHSNSPRLSHSSKAMTSVAMRTRASAVTSTAR